MSRAVVALLAALPATACKSRAESGGDREPVAAKPAPATDAAAQAAIAPPPADDWWRAGCPDGSELRGAAPPRGTAIWCETALGEKHGPFTEWHEPAGDGPFRIERTGQFVDGRRHGVWVTRRADGTLASEVGYRHGKLDGPHRQYDDRGRLAVEGRYARGVPHGRFTGYAGARELGSFEMDRGTGTFRSWHPDGTVAQEYGMRAGLPHGSWIRYGEDGRKLEQTDYAGGVRTGSYRRWSESGALVEEGRYEANMKEGRWIERDEGGAVVRERRYRRGVEQR
jgi:antitoxin component YwqK of YwqJK toxin-antitoxin module